MCIRDSFKGTRSRTAAQLAEEMYAVGGHINAFTTKECTCFYARVLDTHLARAADILCDMFFHSRFDDADVETCLLYTSSGAGRAASPPAGPRHPACAVLKFQAGGRRGASGPAGACLLYTSGAGGGVQ